MNLPGRFNEAGIPAPAGMAGGLAERVGTNDDDRLSLRRLVNLLRRRIWILIGTFVLIVALGLAFTLMQPKIYQADAFVMLKSSGQRLDERVTDQASDPKLSGDADVSTEIQVITSHDIARRVVRTLGLVEKPALLARLMAPGRLETDPASLSPADREKFEDRVVRMVRGGLSAIRVGTSYSLQVSYKHRDPEIAALVANGFADEYVKAQVDDKQQVASEAGEFLAGKVEELRRQATNDFAAVQDYRVSHGLLSSSATALTEQDISVYNQQAASARAEAAADAARLATARSQLQRGSHGDDVGEALSSPVVSSLRTQRSQIGARVADLSTRYGPRHPELARAREELAAVDRQIQEEIDRVISNLEAKSAVSSQRLASLNETLGSARGTLAANNSALVTLDDLQRRAEASQGLYESYLGRYRQLMAGSGTEQPEARVLTAAITPSRPFSPNLFVNMVLAGLVGMVIALVVAIWAELQYRGLTTADDVEKRLGLPYLGLVPENGTLDVHAETPLDTLRDMPNSILAESVRSIYAAAHIPVAGRAKVLAVSSALPSEGKTALAAMLGYTASATGVRAVIVDCDIMLRGLSRLSGVSGKGLREVAANDCDLDTALHYLVGDRLAILPITSRGQDGERLVGKGAIQAIVAQLKERFDVVILDCPPLLALAEAREIAALADGVILAARWRKTMDDAVRSAAKLLPAHLNNYTGVVLTRVDLRRQSRYAEGAGSSYSAYQRYVAAAA